MASPIFSSFYIKKYIVQLRYGQSGLWQDQTSYKRLDEAKYAVQQLLRQHPGAEGRILNRLTGQPVEEP